MLPESTLCDRLEIIAPASLRPDPERLRSLARVLLRLVRADREQQAQAADATASEQAPQPPQPGEQVQPGDHAA